MVNYEFQPDADRPGRNRPVGAWSETGCRSIPLPLTKASLMTLLRYGRDCENAPFTHQEIAWWADECYSSPYSSDSDLEEADLEVAQDIYLQWQMYLANSYTLEELQTLDFSQVQLPAEWFAHWLDQLET